MPKQQLPYNSVLKGRVRPFNLSKCELEGCCNWITSLNFVCKNICGNHQSKTCPGQRLKEFKHLRRISTATRHGVCQPNKRKRPDWRDVNRIE